MTDVLFKEGNIHHAYGLYGEENYVREILFEAFDKLKIDQKGNPDFHHIKTDVLTIDMVRDIITLSNYRSIGGSKKIFVIECRTIPMEGQNAMLKTFEEPTEDTHFFIITPHNGYILPTLSSRIVNISIDDSERKLSEVALSFLTGNYKKRGEIIAKIVKDKDRVTSERIIRDMITYVKNNIIDEEKKRELLGRLLIGEMYITSPSSSQKMILDYLSLTIPKL